jgi:hypothetical protein
MGEAGKGHAIGKREKGKGKKAEVKRPGNEGAAQFSTVVILASRSEVARIAGGFNPRIEED